MQYLTAVLRPFRAIFLTVGAMVFVSGCVTPYGSPVVCPDGYSATPEARCAPNAYAATQPGSTPSSDY